MSAAHGRSGRGPRLGALAAVALVSLAAAALPSLRAAIYRAAAPRAAQAQAQGVAVGEPAPEVAFTTVDGTAHRLSEFRGRPVMLWLFATWCPSCTAGTARIAEHFDTLRAAGLQIIQLELHGNLGYAGPAVEAIAKRAAGSVYPSPQWLFGTASRETSYRYDPGGFPDVYFLIDADGVLRRAGSAPAATLDDILAFAAAAGTGGD